ncbi:hypothetical protein ES703_50135 [subsurface metagenome]
MTVLLERRKPHKPVVIQHENFEAGVFANSKVLLGNWSVDGGYHGKGALQSDTAIATAQLEYLRRILHPTGLLDLWMPDFKAETMVRVETAQDGTGRFSGICVRHLQSLTHYLIGFYAKTPDVKLRIYKSVQGLPRVIEGSGAPCMVGSAIVGRSPLQTATHSTVRAVGSLWTVKLVDEGDNILTKATVPVGEFTANVDFTHLEAPQKAKWQVFDETAALVYEGDLMEVYSFDTFEYGGAGTYWLLGNCDFPWEVDKWYRLGVRVYSRYIVALVDKVEYLTASDTTYTWGKPVLRTIKSQSRFDLMEVRRG